MPEPNIKLNPQPQDPSDKGELFSYLKQSNSISRVFTYVILIIVIIALFIAGYYFYKKAKNYNFQIGGDNTGSTPTPIVTIAPTHRPTKKPTAVPSATPPPVTYTPTPIPTKSPTRTPTPTPTPNPYSKTDIKNDHNAQKNFKNIKTTLGWYYIIYDAYPRTISYSNMMTVLSSSSVNKDLIINLIDLPAKYIAQYCSHDGSQYYFTMSQFAHSPLSAGSAYCTPGQ